MYSAKNQGRGNLGKIRFSTDNQSATFNKQYEIT